jgi:carotenoid 1,2-hydratase
VSDDGASSVVVIAMLGNAFSPRWARARAQDATAQSLDFSAMNVALRSGGSSRWALTERGRASVSRGADHVSIGSSTITHENGSIIARIDERTAPWRERVRGTIRLVPLASSELVVDLDPRGLHTWSPRIPIASLEVDFEEPRVRFRGTGYLDMNQGAAPLEDTFASWSWSRVSDGRQVAVAYDVALRDGARRARSFAGSCGHDLVPARHDGVVELPATRFGLSRTARGETDAISLVRTLEDGPFYARSVLRTTLDGSRAVGMHETVSLDRFRSAWVRFLVPFRMRVEAA